MKAYENFAIKAGMEVNENTKFDCRNVEISKNVDEYFWKWYKDKAKKENPNLSDKEIKTAIAMLMLQNGAKLNENLNDWQILVETGFVDNGEYKPTNNIRR